MPRKKNKRKAIQIAKRKTEGEPKPRPVAIIAHHHPGAAGVTLAALAAGLFRIKSN